MFDVNENGFYVQSDGTFFAFGGPIIIKAERRGESSVYPFVGKASTPDKDRDGESVLQKGLNFAPFNDHGEFNWNHIPHAMTGLPTGRKSWLENGTWMCEGEIIAGLPIWDNYTTDMIIQQHNTLQKAGFQRGLCLSIEGKVTARSDDGKCIKSADVYNIAHTFRPINPNCTVSMLVKAFTGQTQILERDRFFKDTALSTVAPVNPTVRQDLAEHGFSLEDKLVKHLVKKGVKEGAAKKQVEKFFLKKFTGKHGARK